MKIKDIEKQLKNEISEASSCDISEIMSKCAQNEEKELICEPVLATEGAPSYNRARGAKKSLIVTAIAVFIMALAILFMLHLINSRPRGGYIVIDINPSLEIAYDENGCVIDVTPLNEDAEVLLCDVELSGKDYKDAITLLVDNCVKLGYLSPQREDNAIMATAVTEKGEKNERMTETVKQAFTEEFSQRKMLGVVITGVQSPELQEEAEKFGIDAQKYSLIQQYINAGGELSEEEYSKTSIRELYSFIYNKKKEEKQSIRDSLEKEAGQLESELFDKVSRDFEGIKEKLPENSESRERLDEILKKNGEEQIDELIGLLSELENSEDGISKELIAQIKNEISDKKDKYNQKKEELSEISKSPEDKKNERLDVFGEVVEGELDVDLDKWQSEKEEQFQKEWYDQKEQWDSDRKNDSTVPPKGEEPNNEEKPQQQRP